MKLKNFLIFTLIVLISACAQSRRGFIEPAEIEVWEPQELCANEQGLEVKGCFDVTIHYTDNFAEFYVIDIGINPQDAAQFPYRVLGRSFNRSTGRLNDSWHLLKSGITATKGGSFIVEPRGDRNAWIEDYQEFIVELESRISADGFGYEPASPGLGERLTRGDLIFPELFNN